MNPTFAIKRVSAAPTASDGYRVLVERLWPRGVKRESLKLDAWMREVAPSTELRKWFAHDPVKWPEFQNRYHAELDANPAPWQELLKLAKRQRLTLLFSSHDAEHNNVVALRSYLEAKARK